MRKTFHAGPAASRTAAARTEYDRLAAFTTALDGVPGAACPRPLALLDDPPGLRMTRAAGVNLSDLLASAELEPSRSAWLAATIAAALLAYGGVRDEPYPDLTFDNLLHDDSTGTLTFVDLGDPQDAVAPPPGQDHVETALGDLLGSVLYRSARPGSLLDRRRHRQSAALAAAVVAATSDAGGRSRPVEVVTAARAAWVRCVYGRSRRRDAWYASVGRVVAYRPRLSGGLVVRPVGPPDAARRTSTRSGS